MKRIVVLAGLCLLYYNTSAQQTFASLQDLLRYADGQAIELRSARVQEELSTVQQHTAKSAMLPAVNATAGVNDNITLQPTLVPARLFNPAAPEGTYNEYTFGRKYVYSTGVQVNWDLIHFQKWFALKTASVRILLSQAALIQARYATYNRLAQTYYSILLSRKYQSLSRDNALAADSIYQMTVAKYQQGILGEESLNRAHILQLQAKQQLSKISADLEQLMLQLQAQLNTTEPVILREELMPEAQADPVPAGDPVHPELRGQQYRLALAEANLNQAHSAYYPSLSLRYQYNYNWAMDRLTDFGQGNTLPQQYVGLQLNIPVLNGMAVRDKVRESRLNVQTEQLKLAATQRSTAKEDEMMQVQYRQARIQLQQQTEIVQLQQVNDRHTASRYASGIISLDERLDKFQNLLQIQQQYMQSLSDYYVCYYKIYIRQNID